jgi:hypothetical protein
MSDNDSSSVLKKAAQRMDHLAFGYWIEVGCELVE